MGDSNTRHYPKTPPVGEWIPNFVREVMGASDLTDEEALSLAFSEGLLYFE